MKNGQSHVNIRTKQHLRPKHTRLLSKHYKTVNQQQFAHLCYTPDTLFTRNAMTIANLYTNYLMLVFGMYQHDHLRI